jgi:hypothetical protein
MKMKLNRVKKKVSAIKPKRNKAARKRISGVPGPDLYENGKLQSDFPTIFEVMESRNKKNAS